MQCITVHMYACFDFFLLLAFTIHILLIRLKYNSNMTKQFNNFFEENYIRNLQFDSFENDITVLSSNSYKLVSKTYDKIVVLSKISFSNKYTIKDFINDLIQYRKVELHENILKFIGIIKQSTYGIMFIHEYANEGTLRQYLDQNFCMLNWFDKLKLAKQLVSAIKCLHESDIVYLNLNPNTIFVHKGNLKLNQFGAFQYRNQFLNKFKLIQYTDPQYLKHHETYKLNKSSDIYSIGVLLWEISSGIIPFKSELSYGFNLLSAIIYGKRESPIPGTPKKYVKLYTECWRYNSNLRPTIQHVFKELNNIHYTYEEVITESIKKKEYKEKSISKMKCSNPTNLLQHFIDLRYEMIKELEIISSIIKTLNKALTSLDL
ncbi:kinase-like protein [Gigaspora margarita]|uniref:Kinase-like protein n=1 Tax=Gigaspora margarita TaxID=4874 RepID=A0A8H4AJW6_GIGMA|nr:kinase-like protein [Gigaspora margarita]